MSNLKTTCYRTIEGETEKYTIKYATDNKRLTMFSHNARGLIYPDNIDMGRYSKSEILTLAKVIQEIGEEI